MTRQQFGRIPTSPLSVESRPTGDRIVVVVAGSVTVDSAAFLRPVLHQAIGAAPVSGVTVDFSDTAHLDTSAIATLLEAATLASQGGIMLRAVGLGGDARVIAEGAELDRIFSALGCEVVFS